MSAFDKFLDWFGHRLATRLRNASPDEWPYAPSDPAALSRALRPGDVILVSSADRISRAIKYLTQSTWSHAAIYVGEIDGRAESSGEVHVLIEVNLGEGCVSVPLSKYARAHTRICRAVGLRPNDQACVVTFMTSRIGLKYDLRNIIDMARYFVPLPFPQRFRRRMISFGSGEPTRAICSTLIAQAFQSIRYPILPRVERVRVKRLGISRSSREEILHIRHHSLFAPCDFDLSPYFRIVKPTIEEGFDYKALQWGTKKDASTKKIPEQQRLSDLEGVHDGKLADSGKTD
jgi:hypothetical protein